MKFLLTELTDLEIFLGTLVTTSVTIIVNKFLNNTLKNRLWRSFESIPTLGSTVETNNWHLLLRIFPLATHKGCCILNNLGRSVIMTPKNGDSEVEYTEDAQEVFE